MDMPIASPLRRATVLAAALALAACASAPTRDGAEANPPSDLERVPDAEPRVEAPRTGGPNKPYEVMGRRYTPVVRDEPMRENGLASWYGRKFHGRPTASGEVYDMYAMTAAHKTMPLPSYARVRNPANGREIIVRVNDRGPFSAGRVIDLSYTAALKLGVLNGVAPVQVERLTNADIRSGRWQRPD
jgi:rare lipoprotein A